MGAPSISERQTWCTGIYPLYIIPEQYSRWTLSPGTVFISSKTLALFRGPNPLEDLKVRTPSPLCVGLIQFGYRFDLIIIFPNPLRLSFHFSHSSAYTATPNQLIIARLN